MKTNLIYDMSYLMYRNKAITEKNLDTQYFNDLEMVDLYQKYRDGEVLSTKQKNILTPYISEMICRFTIHKTLTEIINYNKTFKSNRVICCFDSPHPWRKKIAGEYKQDRVAKRDSEIFDYKVFYKALSDLQAFIRDHTEFIALEGSSLEADDIIYLVCKHLYLDELKIVITADKDLLQILKFKNCKLYNPLKKEFRTIEKDLKIGKIEFDTISSWKFAAIINGQKNNAGKVFEGKRIGPARAKKLYSPQTNFSELKKLFEEIVGSKDKFKANILLVDFEKIPIKYINRFMDMIREQNNHVPDCSYEPVLHFLHKYGLNNLLDRLEYFLEEIS